MKLYSDLAQILATFLQPALSNSVDVYPNSVNTGNSVAQFTSGVTGFDGPKVSSLNGTSYDWCHGCWFPVLAPRIWPAIFENGTSIFYPVNNAAGTAGDALIVTSMQGSAGFWKSTGAQWVGSPLLTDYIITVDSPAIGVHGTLTLSSVAPAHYPCGPVAPGANLEVSPNIGWANAVPDANAVANFTICGSSLQFNGVGYHDKNWGVQPFTDNVASWYWGHGRLSPYSIVWFDVIGADGNEYLSSYAALNGVIVASACSGIKVRPTGNNSQYPPVVSTSNPEGFHIDLNLPSGKILSVDATTKLVVANAVLYARYTGTLRGGVKGESTTYEGVALYEEFKLVK